MATITSLTAQTAASGDELAANRAGADCKLLAQDIAALLSASSDTVAGKIEIATQSEQETATDTTRIVTPGTQHFSPAVAKFWVYWTGNSTTILLDYNVDSVANSATGDADITITTDFSSANWAGMVSVDETDAEGWDANSIMSCGFNARAAGTCGVLCGSMVDGNTAAGNTANPGQWSVVGFGDLA